MTMRARDTASDDAIAEQAARWVVALTADDAAAREKARIGFERWRQADRRHAEAAARMEHLVEQMQRMRADGTTRPARAALSAAFTDGRRGRARRMGAALALVLAFGLPGWLAVQAYPLSYLTAALTADARTGTGEWATRTLADDTRLTLGSGSAVDLRFDESRRTVELLRGEILVDVAPDAARPFMVETPHGRMRALGTRFAVVREADVTVLTVLESKVAVEPPSSPAGPIVQAGQRVRLTAAGPGPVTAVDVRSVEGAWRFRQLVVQGEPLPDVLDRLSRHRRGLIRYDRAALEAIKVSAVLPLDDTDRALSLLAASFPAIRVRTLTPWLVLVDAPGGP
ncbi:FecR family protein [Azospirillum sp.]|uniref:FecR family protein n=1 Tax=Azospirillum sp. TaxID=34012 RepID=UPI002D2F239E|nr:FecR domain-containing protein [Azospirillum sp.]HYD65506.1 FecR domain-containing protein [Azospirillum sp.]